MLPRFTLRQALVLLTVGALVAFGLTQADADQTAVFGLAAAFGSLVLAFTFYALFYVVALVLSPPPPIKEANAVPATASGAPEGEDD